MWSALWTTRSVCHSPEGILISNRAQLDPLSGDDLVDPVVVFQRVHAGDVVVVGVLVSPHRPAALIELARHRFEGDGQVDVGEAGILRNAEVEEAVGALVGGLGQDLLAFAVVLARLSIRCRGLRRSWQPPSPWATPRPPPRPAIGEGNRQFHLLDLLPVFHEPDRRVLALGDRHDQRAGKGGRIALR